MDLCSDNSIRDFEVERWPWIIRVDPKCNHERPFRREAEGARTRAEEEPATVEAGIGQRGQRSGDGAATTGRKGQGADSAPETQRPLRAPRGADVRRPGSDSSVLC